MKTFSQDFRPLGLLDPNAQDVATPIGQHGERQIDLDPHRGLVTNLHAERIEEHDGIQRLERSALPGGHFGDHRIGDRAGQIGRDVDGIRLAKEGLDFPDGQAAGVQRDDLLVEPREPALVLADQLRLKGAVAITRHVDRDRSVVRQHRLAARPVAVIGDQLRLRRAGRVAEMVRQLGAERPLDQAFLKRRDAVSMASAVSGPSRTI